MPAGPSGPDAAAPDGGRQRTRWGRPALVAALVGLVALLGSGAGAYAVARNSALGEQTVRCGGTRCIPGLKPAMIVDALTQQGFACEEGSYGSWACQLNVAGADFRTYLDSHEGLVTGLSGSVHPGYEDQVPATTRSFLVWLGSIPVAHDPVAVEEISGWLDQRFEGGANAEATIGRYRYELKAENKENIDLVVRVEG